MKTFLAMILKRAALVAVAMFVLAVVALGSVCYVASKPVPLTNVLAVFYAPETGRPGWAHNAPAWIRDTGAKWAWVRNLKMLSVRPTDRAAAAWQGSVVTLSSYGPMLVARLNGGVACSWNGRWVLLRQAEAKPGLVPRSRDNPPKLASEWALAVM